jgi:hypothetical protein
VKSSLELLNYKRDTYSHNGEDGVLEFLLQRLPNKNHWAVEFGAWDGKLASNTCQLLDSGQWNVLFIECDQKKYATLQHNHGQNPKAHLLCKFIAFAGHDSLDELFQHTSGFPQDPDLVSMDIDGCEYHLWESLHRHQPKIIITEFNPSIPLDHAYVQAKDFAVNHSSSLKAFVELAQRKGYRLVSVLDYNAIFVREELIAQMQLVPASMEELFAPFKRRYQTQIWQSMDGRLHLLGCDRLIWHNVTINPNKIQVLPRFLQINPAGTGWLRKILRFVYHKTPFVPQLFNFVVSGRFHVPQPFRDP